MNLIPLDAVIYKNCVFAFSPKASTKILKPIEFPEISIKVRGVSFVIHNMPLSTTPEFVNELTFRKPLKLGAGWQSNQPGD